MFPNTEGIKRCSLADSVFKAYVDYQSGSHGYFFPINYVEILSNYSYRENNHENSCDYHLQTVKSDRDKSCAFTLLHCV